MTSVLVVFLSRTGHTASVGKAVAEGLSAEAEQLQEKRERAYFLAALDALVRRASALQDHAASVGDYDLVVLGTPVWAMSLPAPMRSYISAHADTLPNVAFFCTEGGVGRQRVFGQMDASAANPHWRPSKSRRTT